MNKNKSMADCIADNDFETAFYRYKHTSLNWEGRWWDTVCKIYYSSKEWAKKYFLDPIKRTIKTAIEEIADAIFTVFPITFARGTKLCYLFKFYDTEGKLLFSKIGTTIRTIKERVLEEKRQYSKNFEISHIIIEKVFDCGEIIPELVENWVKAKAGIGHNNDYIKNDRFTYDISVEDFNNYVTEYLGMVA